MRGLSNSGFVDYCKTSQLQSMSTHRVFLIFRAFSLDIGITSAIRACILYVRPMFNCQDTVCLPSPYFFPYPINTGFFLDGPCPGLPGLALPWLGLINAQLLRLGKPRILRITYKRKLFLRITYDLLGMHKIKRLQLCIITTH